MEQEKVADPSEKQESDEDAEDLIEALDAAPRGPGLGAMAGYGQDGSDVLSRDLDDDDDEEDDDGEGGFAALTENPKMRNAATDEMLTESGGGNLTAPPPHLIPNVGGTMSSPEPRQDQHSGRINEEVEGEEVQELDNETQETEAEEDNEGDPDAVTTAPGGSMTSTGPGGHRLDTLDGAAAGLRALPINMGSGAPGQDDDDDDEDDDDDDVQAPVPEGAYDPAEYDNLNVSPEVRELFTYITRYTPQAIELEHRLRPYIPDYIPAVGDIDAFIKILPPDGSETKVGLTVLDEPSARQSDATVQDLQLRALARHTTAKTVAVKTVESAEKNPKVVEKWVRDISDLHRARPPPTVHYTKRMPDIDSLMQEWPGELEEMLHDIRLPNAALDLDLDNYAGLICAIMDIPVYKSKIQSLHVLFTLYSEFRNSVHFRRLAENNYMDNDDEAAERLVID